MYLFKPEQLLSKSDIACKVEDWVVNNAGLPGNKTAMAKHV